MQFFKPMNLYWMITINRCLNIKPVNCFLEGSGNRCRAQLVACGIQIQARIHSQQAAYTGLYWQSILRIFAMNTALFISMTMFVYIKLGKQMSNLTNFRGQHSPLNCLKRRNYILLIVKQTITLSFCERSGYRYGMFWQPVDYRYGPVSQQFGWKYGCYILCKLIYVKET